MLHKRHKVTRNRVKASEKKRQKVLNERQNVASNSVKVKRGKSGKWQEESRSARRQKVESSKKRQW